MSAPRLPWLENESPHDLVRWVVAAAIVVSLHGAAVAFALSWRGPTEIGGDFGRHGDRACTDRVDARCGRE